MIRKATIKDIRIVHELLHEYGRFLRGESKGQDLPSVLDGVRATVCSLKVLDALKTGEVQQFGYPW